jgi:PIN domain nuclease of toxin-antitoxin system
MKCIVDTHFLVWITAGHERLREFPWLERYAPYGVSPISLLEMQYLGETGRLAVDMPAFRDALARDGRFALDEAPLLALIDQALPMAWTRDPFDRLLSAHSAARRLPLVTLDRAILDNHRFLPEELRSD